MQEIEQGQTSSIQIIEDVLVVNNCIVPYKQQILRNKNTLFVVDLGIEVPVDEQLREYDEYYFQFLLKEQIVAEIEASHITVGLAVLQAMPQIEQQHYAYIFRKLSITKLTKMLMSDDFLVFLASTFNGFAGIQMRQEVIKEAIARLAQPYQRVIFLLKILEEQSGELKEEVHATAQEILYTMIDEANFIKNLAFPENNQEAEEEDDDDEEEKTKEESSVSKDLSPNFLVKLCQFAISTQYIQRIPLELRSEFSYELNKDVKEKLFSKDCFKIIGQYFYDLSLSERRSLLLVMNLLATHNCDDFWNEIILCPSLKKPTKIEGGQEPHETSTTTVDNVNTLKVLLQNNYYNNNFSDWDQSMHLLQQLCEGKGEADLMLTELFEDLVHNPNIQAIDLFTIFTKKVFQRNKEYMPHFKRILTAFLTFISEGVERLYKDYQQQFQRFHIHNKIKSTVVMLMKLNFPRVNSLLACAYLRVFNVVITHNIYDFVSTIDLQRPIEQLLTLTNNRSGAIEGSRKTLVRLITTKLQNLKIKTRSSHSKSLSLPLPKLRAYLQTQP